MPAKDPKQYDLSWVRDRRLTCEELLQYKEERHRPPCLVCGRKLRLIGTHLKVHQMDTEEYKDFYGIPRFMSLTDSETRALKSEQTKGHHADGLMSPGGSPEYMKTIGAIKRRLIRPEIKAVLAIENLKEINKDCSRLYSRCKKLAATHTEEETLHLRREAGKKNIKSHPMNIKLAQEARRRSGIYWTPERAAIQANILRERAEIIRNTPMELLEQALSEHEKKCRRERNRRRRERRHAALKAVMG